MLARPVHAGPLQPPLHDELVGALDAATAERIAPGVTPGMGEHFPALRQIAQALLHRRPRLGLLPSLGRHGQLPQGGQYRIRTPMVQCLALVGKPSCAGQRALAIDRLPSLGHIAQGMGKIQDAHRIRPMEVDEALDPLRPIAHGTSIHGLGRLGPASVRFHQGQTPEGRRIN